MGRSTTDQWIGARIADRYRLDRMIGQGGMGTVYEAVHLWTERRIALKLIETDASEIRAKRILSEARSAASVRHPHLVEVLDVGSVDPTTMYLVLELLHGESLESLLDRKGPLRAADTLDIVVPILDALHALHKANIVHRDVKPGNIFLDDDGSGRIVPKLLDLGISKRLDANDNLTATGSLLGTPSHMPPEQARGVKDIGPSADIWAIGVVLFECLTGQRPFVHDTLPGLLHLIATERPAPIASIATSLPRALAAAVDRALAYDAADRHASAKEFADALVNAALDAGWPLTCRIPAGPLISLTPDAPVTASDPTPIMMDANATPSMTGSLEPVSLGRADPKGDPASSSSGPSSTAREIASASRDREPIVPGDRKSHDSLQSAAAGAPSPRASTLAGAASAPAPSAPAPSEPAPDENAEDRSLDETLAARESDTPRGEASSRSAPQADAPPPEAVPESADDPDPEPPPPEVATELPLDRRWVVAAVAIGLAAVAGAIAIASPWSSSSDASATPTVVTPEPVSTHVADPEPSHAPIGATPTTDPTPPRAVTPVEPDPVVPATAQVDPPHPSSGQHRRSAPTVSAPPPVEPPGEPPATPTPTVDEGTNGAPIISN
ncbi:MAG: serine/threonine-protein kinase [Sandaracinaceae bacterium]